MYHTHTFHLCPLVFVQKGQWGRVADLQVGLKRCCFVATSHCNSFEDDCPQPEAHLSSELHLCLLPWNRSGRHMPCHCLCPVHPWSAWKRWAARTPWPKWAEWTQRSWWNSRTSWTPGTSRAEWQSWATWYSTWCCDRTTEGRHSGGYTETTHLQRHQSNQPCYFLQGDLPM